MNYNIYRAATNHSFLIEKNVKFLNINECDFTYQIFERVFLNVSAKRGVSWQSVYYAKESDTLLYSDLIVCLLLIEKYVKFEFDKSDDEIISLLGFELYNILESYRNYLTKKI